MFNNFKELLVEGINEKTSLSNLTLKKELLFPINCI